MSRQKRRSLRSFSFPRLSFQSASPSFFFYKYQAEIIQEPIRSTVEKILFRHGVVFVPSRWNENYSMVERNNLCRYKCW